MSLAESLVVILGLSLFELISSIDNAVINADVLAGVSERAKRWFLRYGIFFAVFVVRGLLPLLIVYFSAPELGFVNAFTATWSSDPKVASIIEHQKPILLAGGGLYLVLLFLHWLFVEKKEYAFFWEKHIHQKMYFWFYALASAVLLAVVWLTMKANPLIGLGAVVGSTAFFIANGFKHNAEEVEKRMLGGGSFSDVSKIVYLELIDLTFSIDGVLGAFAFTLSIPLILIGNGLGALAVRYVTVYGVNTVKKYRFLKNGAMYSVASLGVIMLLESLAVEVYTLLPPLITLVVIGIFFWLSVRELKVQDSAGRV